jgi:hypothetical protein
MATRQEIINEAMEWLGTPFVHQDRTKGQGVDCVNFIAALAIATGAVPDVEFERDYRMHENGETMVRLFRSYLNPIDWRDALPADVFVVRYNADHWHCMLVKEREEGLETNYTVIEAGRECVCMHRIDLAIKRRIHSCYRLKNILD